MSTAGLGIGDFRVIVYEPALTKLMAKNEPPDKFARRMQTLTYTFAVRTAPVSGRKTAWGRHPASENLKNQHRRRGRLRRGPRDFGYGISNGASYARYVHEGTTVVVARKRMRRNRKNGRISGGLWANAAELDFIPGAGIVLLGNHVRGQDANPWLRNAGMAAFEAQSKFLA
jgi:hypothetical protein